MDTKLRTAEQVNAEARDEAIRNRIAETMRDAPRRACVKNGRMFTRWHGRTQFALFVTDSMRVLASVPPAR